MPVVILFGRNFNLWIETYLAST